MGMAMWLLLQKGFFIVTLPGLCNWVHFQQVTNRAWMRGAHVTVADEMLSSDYPVFSGHAHPDSMSHAHPVAFTVPSMMRYLTQLDGGKSSILSQDLKRLVRPCLLAKLRLFSNIGTKRLDKR
jgi:hypothetical protein